MAQSTTLYSRLNEHNLNKKKKKNTIYTAQEWGGGDPDPRTIPLFASLFYTILLNKLSLIVC